MTLENGVVRQRGNESDFRLEDEYDEDTHDESQGPQQRNAANARERARMRVLSKAFCRLKTTLPWVPPDTKLSKLDTLRLATGYIAHLRAILKLSENEAPDPTMQPLSMSWPFNFHMHWDNQTSSKATIIDVRPKNDWSACIHQYPAKKASYHHHHHEEEEEVGRKSKAYYESADSEKGVNRNGDSKNRRRNDFPACESSRAGLYSRYDNAETNYYKSYKPCPYYDQL